MRGFERRLLAMTRPLELAERMRDTRFFFVVGGRDPGTWPTGLRMLGRRLDEVGGGHTWLEWPRAYHSVWVPAFHDGALLKILDPVRRPSRPAHVILRTGLYRDAEQRWVRVDQMRRFGLPARIEAVVRPDGKQVDVMTQNVEGMTLALDEAPCASRVTVRVDGQRAYSGAPRSITLARRADGRFTLGRVRASPPGERKVRGLSGPIEDRDHAFTVYVYGTLRMDSTAMLPAGRPAGAFPAGGVRAK